MLAGILAALQALPSLLSLINKIGPGIVDLLKGLSKSIKHMTGNDAQGWTNKVGQAISQLNAAKTPEEKQQAAEIISKLLRDLP